MSLYKRPDSPYWWTKFTVGGQQTRQSTGTADRAEAALVEARLRQQRWAVAYAGAHTWADAALRWMAEHQQKRSHEKDKAIIAWFHQEGRLRGRLLHEINRDVLHELHQAKARETSPATANRYMALLRAILNAACHEWEWIAKVPKAPMFRLEPPAFQWLTREEFAALLEHLPKHTRAIARFAVATGLRRSNITGLTWSQVDLVRGHLYVEAAAAKGKRAIPVPLNADALAVLRECEGTHARWVFTRGKKVKRPVRQVATRAWRTAVKAIGRPGFRFHDLRHTWASWHAQAGTPAGALQALGGWRSAAMVQRYAHFDSTSLRAHVEATARDSASVPRNVPNPGRRAEKARAAK